ncbi:hypothetical protein AX16_005288 [Volvariella volvacea WC 439]|nr:hypothetical protein AX16_005288 [Volvariella volvacea WC 439]
MMTQISLQLANLSNPLTYTDNPVLGSLSFDPEPRKSYAVAVNTLWFLSLSISLSTVLVGILCLQWIREYQRDPHQLSPIESILLRQLRYAGLKGWKVPQVISILPVLLQLAVLLFFAGLCHFLYELERAVAVAIMTVTCIVTLILFGTALAPIMQTVSANDTTLPEVQCPYKSPQAWLCFVMIRSSALWLATIVYWLSFRLFGDPIFRWLRGIEFYASKCQSWTQWDEQWKRSAGQAVYIQSFIQWTCETWAHRGDVFNVVPGMLVHLDSLELYVKMIDMLYQQGSPWFNDDFVAALLSQVHERISHAPEDLASLPTEQHEKLLRVLHHEGSPTTKIPQNDIPLKPLAQFLYWSWIHQDAKGIGVFHIYVLGGLAQDVVTRTEKFTFLHNSTRDLQQQSERNSEDEARELDISEMETCLIVVGFSDAFPQTTTFGPFGGHVFELPEAITMYIRALYHEVYPVLQTNKENWKEQANRGDGAGWHWLVALTAGIQLALTKYGMVGSVGRNHPQWKEFYEAVMEKSYGPWEGDLPRHPSHAMGEVELAPLAVLRLKEDSD